MKRFFKYLFLLQAAVLFTAACGKSAEEEFPGNRGSLEKAFRASMPSTKVAVDVDQRALWEDGDDISVEGARFTLESPGSASAVFRGTVAKDKDNYLAMLPWTDAYVFGERTVSGTLPNRQPANEGGCAWPLAYGWSVGSSITFHHLTTVLQLTLGDDMTDVREIVLRGNGGETLAGDFSLALDSGGAFSSFAEGPMVYKSVALTGTLEANKTYCFNVLGLGTKFESGLTLEFLFANGTSAYITESDPITLNRREWVNLSNGITKDSLTPMSKGIASPSDWNFFKTALEAGTSLDAWSWNGEILLKADIALSASDALNTLDIPLNGNGHTISYAGTTSFIGTLYADVHDLTLAGSIDFAGNSAVGALASTVSTGVTVSNVNSSADITAGALGMTNALMIGGLAGTVSGDSGSVMFDNCTVTGTIKSLNYAHSVGGILAHGGSGSAPESIFEGCTFNGKITYAQGSCPFDFRDGYNKDRTAGRVGGIIGDASRVSVLRDCSTGGACTMDIRLNGMTLGNGGVGGLVGRTTGDVGGYTMSVTLEGTNTNNAAITVHDAKFEQHSRFGQVVGSKIKATVGSGTESGSLTFVDTPAPSTTGHFRLCQVAPRHTVSIKYSLDNTRSSATQHYMSYLIVTTNNKVIVVDGGWEGDAPYLKSLIKSFGGHVDAWFISHPHQDHVEALSEILAPHEGITIGTIYHSKASPARYNSSDSDDVVTKLYSRIEAFGCEKVDIREPGGRYDIDGVGIKVLSVSDEVLSTDLNNSSLVLRIWDDAKSVVFLGDCGILEGRKLLATCPEDLNCDFLQLGHHGNKGPEQAFYEAVSFSYALVPTAEWIWHPELYYSSTPSNLDGGATRGWIEAKVPGKVITSYEHGDVWIDESGKYSFTGNTIGGFIKDESDYFN